jgi:hypothetical protein
MKPFAQRPELVEFILGDIGYGFVGPGADAVPVELRESVDGGRDSKCRM